MPNRFDRRQQFLPSTPQLNIRVFVSQNMSDMTNADYTILVESKESGDNCCESRVLKSILPVADVFFAGCAGKDNVEAFYHSLRRSNPELKLIPFTDHDLSHSGHPEIIRTPCYEIENLLTTMSAICHLFGEICPTKEENVCQSLKKYLLILGHYSAANQLLIKDRPLKQLMTNNGNGLVKIRTLISNYQMDQYHYTENLHTASGLTSYTVVDLATSLELVLDKIREIDEEYINSNVRGKLIIASICLVVSDWSHFFIADISAEATTDPTENSSIYTKILNRLIEITHSHFSAELEHALRPLLQKFDP